VSWVTVSTKVKKELLEKAKEYGINVSEVLRKALEEEVRKREEDEARKAAKELAEALKASNITIEDVVKSIREDRDNR